MSRSSTGLARVLSQAQNPFSVVCLTVPPLDATWTHSLTLVASAVDAVTSNLTASLATLATGNGRDRFLLPPVPQLGKAVEPRQLGARHALKNLRRHSPGMALDPRVVNSKNEPPLRPNSTMRGEPRCDPTHHLPRSLATLLRPLLLPHPPRPPRPRLLGPN